MLDMLVLGLIGLLPESGHAVDVLDERWAKANRLAIAPSHPIRPGAAPFLVALLHRSSDVQFCSGAILSRRFVLTTATCATSYKFEHLAVVAGGVLSGFYEGVEQVAFPVSVTLHREFIPSEVTPTDDIALIEVWPHFVFHDLVGRIRIPHHSAELREKTPLMLFGSETTGKIRRDKNKVRQAAATVVFAMSSEDCLQEMLDADTPLIFFPQFLCTSGGFLRGRNCHGDRGSPLIEISERDGKATLVGLLSWTAACQSPGFPAVFTRMSYYAPWIKGQVEDIKRGL